MDRDECLTADWQTIGYEDGARGRTLSYLGNHRKACAEHGVTPDMEGYKQGRLAGLEEYCIPSNGFELGRSGKKLNPVCQPPMARDFEIAWSHGLEIHKAKSRLNNSQRAVKRQQKRLDKLYTQIEEMEAELVSDGIDSKRRKELLAEIKVLNADAEDAELALSELKDQVLSDRDDLLRVEARYHY